MKKDVSILWLIAAVLASIAGWALFIVLFVPDFNIYWLILSPIIIAFYQAPAVFLFGAWRERKRRAAETGDDDSAD